MSLSVLKDNNLRVVSKGNLCAEFSEDWLTAVVTVSYPHYERTYTMSAEAAINFIYWR